MAKVLSMDISQSKVLSDQLLKYGAKVGVELENALNDEAQVIAVLAKEFVPVDLGNLRASIKVNPPLRALHEEGEIYVEIVAGDTAVQYAEIQEENEEFNHPNGGQAHYMRDAAITSLAGVEGRIMEKIARLQ